MVLGAHCHRVTAPPPPLRLSRAVAASKLAVPTRRPRSPRRQVLRFVFYLFVLVAFQWAWKQAPAAADLLHDPTAPTQLFWTFQVSDSAVLVVRPWAWPHLTRITESFTKQHTRARPIAALQRRPRPAEYGCPKSPDSPLVFVGVFSTFSALDRRALMRKYQKPQLANMPPNMVTWRFVLGEPRLKRDRLALRKEAEQYGDIVILDEEENMNMGKTYAFFRYLAKKHDPAPQFAFKTDDDTLLSVANLVNLLETLDCSSLCYMGRCSSFSCGMYQGWPAFFTGMAYGLSAPLYRWIGSADIGAHKVRGPEDVRTAQLLLNLDRDRYGEELIRLNLDGRMKDFKYVGGEADRIDPNTIIAVHPYANETVLAKFAARMAERKRDNKEPFLRKMHNALFGSPQVESYRPLKP